MTQQELYNHIFTYKDGTLVYRNPPRGKSVGEPAGTLDDYGYISVIVRGRMCKAHRIVWTMHHGDIPAGMEIDHKNRKRTDNRLDNLRLATPNQNQHNRVANRASKTGVKGVSWSKSNKAYRVDVQAYGKRHVRFAPTLNEAAAMAASLRSALHGEFSNNKEVTDD